MKNFTKLLTEYINEVIAQPSGDSFVVKSDEGNNFVLKSNGSQPWIKSLGGGLSCFSVYKMTKTENDVVDPVSIIKSLKAPTSKESLKVPRGTVDQILQKGVELCVPWLEDLDVNIVTTPQSSKTLSVKFGKMISQNLGTKFVPAGTMKDLESAKISSELPSSYSEKSTSGLTRSLERMKSSKSKDLNKHFRPRDRKFITNWQKIRDEDQFEQGSNVLLVDDVISDGATMLEMTRTLKKMGVNVVGCITLFKTTK